MQTRQYMKEISLDVLRHKANNIKWFFSDVDGTLTDGGVYYSSEGECLKRFSLKDGTGFFLLRQAGIKVGIITGEDSPIVAQRAKKLNVDKYLCGSHKKVEALESFLKEENLSLDEIAYIGDELNDVKLINKCGFGFAVGDADHRVKSAALYVCKQNGGRGAFREAVEQLFVLRQIDIDGIVEKSL